MDYNKMKVNDLKTELASRNLDTKGVKAVLVERLKEAIEKENNENSALSTPTIAAARKTDVGTPNPSTPARRSRRRSMTRSPSPAKVEISALESVSEEPEQIETTELSNVSKKRRTRSITKSPSPVKTVDVKRLEVLEEEPETATKTTENVVPRTDETKPVSPIKLPATPNKQSTPTKTLTSSPKTAIPEKSTTSSTSPTVANAVKPIKENPTKPTATPVQTLPISPTNATIASPVKPITVSPTKSATGTPTKPTITPSKSPPKQVDLKETITVTPSETDNSTVKASNESLNAEAQLDELKQVDKKASGNESAETTPECEDSANAPEDEGKGSTEGSQKAAKRKSSPPAKESPSKTPRSKPVQTPIIFVSEENEPDIDDKKFALSWFDSDLNLEIDGKTLDTAKPLSEGALALIWAGARANMGVNKGKVAFEVLLTKNNESKNVTEEPVSNELRVGWSTSKANLQLGEDKHSFSYGSVGLKGTNCEFSDYGIKYNVNDVVGVYLNMDSNPCKIEFTVNNVSQGVAFEFDPVELEGQALFPHVCSKNVAFKVNFGQLERSMLNDREPSKKTVPETEENKIAQNKKANENEEKNLMVEATTESTGATIESTESTDGASSITKAISETSDKPADNQGPEKSAEREKACNEEVVKELQYVNKEFIYIEKSPKEYLVSGISRPETRKDCEVIFLIGLPGSGKSHWIKTYLEANPDKKVTVLGVGTLLDQMKVLGKPRQPSNTNKWSRLVEQLSRSLNKLNEIASKRRRNFILDQQTNVFASEQKRRLRGFGEYATRRAVVILPDTEEYNRRFKLKNEAVGAEAQEGNINAMKAHFYIPTLELGWFTEITYAELDEEKAREEVKKLNDAGRKALPRGYNKNQQQRRGTNQRWNQGFGNNRHGGQSYPQGGFSAPQRYNNSQQYSQNRNYRPGNGYGRREAGGFGGNRYGNNNTDWTRNSGRYDSRYNNRGYQNNQSRRFDGSRNDYRGYNSGSNWSQDSNCWGGYGSQGNDTNQWYSWWQQGGSGTDNSAQHANMEHYWSQYAQQQNYGNYQQSKSHGSGSSKNK
ncbi:heterogeneous nuclear ribonucleoprotein U-like isoform X2 [Topomyia yanbarensis]|uniref:heterogeneous nuclear ribonucleoprotein U-like isoform X2 n=1 Tax=Topomyia yanbarensis TaxID=2498891 RepID=UPI00273CE8A2|nr:heterogeneous nuclear ribonucleoprotein U-like isoform X2 [Topomyia yanbarensis]